VRVQAGVALGAALAIGAVWQLTPFKRRAMRDCHRSLPLAPSGRAADVGVARFGAVNGTACVRSCWPSMLAMAVVPAAQMLLWMPVLAALVVLETTGQRPIRAARRCAVALAVGSLAAFAVG
jgi:predicted metal-binding membrane protein